jgi:hypothetical protein
VAPFVEHPSLPRNRRPRRDPPVRVRGPRSSAAAPSTPTRHGRVAPPPGAPPHSSRGPAPLRDRGSVLLIVFTSALLLMVGLISLAAVVDRTWVLIPVLAIDVTLTTAVLASVLRLMGNDNGE